MDTLEQQVAHEINNCTPEQTDGMIAECNKRLEFVERGLGYSLEPKDYMLITSGFHSGAAWAFNQLPQYKIYTHTGSGHCIGSHISVVSTSKETAEKQIRGLLDATGLHAEQLNIVELQILPNQIITCINGDY